MYCLLIESLYGEYIKRDDKEGVRQMFVMCLLSIKAINVDIVSHITITMT